MGVFKRMTFWLEGCKEGRSGRACITRRSMKSVHHTAAHDGSNMGAAAGRAGQQWLPAVVPTFRRRGLTCRGMLFGHVCMQARASKAQ
eukprot:358672-Chlamydomonas_euryale.AAC.2